MAFTKFKPLAFVATLAMLGSVEPPAAAATTQTIPIYLHNQTRTTPMTCRVFSMKTFRGPRPARPILVGTFNVTPMNERPDSQRNQPQRFSVTVSRYAKNIRGEDLYRPLRMRCELEGVSTSGNFSPTWDNKDKAFRTHELTGSCRDGAVCNLTVRRRT